MVISPFTFTAKTHISRAMTKLGARAEPNWSCSLRVGACRAAVDG